MEVINVDGRLSKKMGEQSYRFEKGLSQLTTGLAPNLEVNRRGPSSSKGSRMWPPLDLGPEPALAS